MCGICGIWNYQSQEPVDRDLLEHMTASMVHRGPDDSGFYLAVQKAKSRLAFLENEHLQASINLTKAEEALRLLLKKPTCCR